MGRTYGAFIYNVRMRGMKRLNHRQQALIAHALRHPHSTYTIESHRMSHGITYGTAHGDLTQLHAKGLLVKETVGKALHFRPSKDLAERLADEVFWNLLLN